MKYNWNQDTIDHFRWEAMYEKQKKIEKRIREFVEIECYIDDRPGSEDDLVDDLMEQVYKPLNLI